MAGSEAGGPNATAESDEALKDTRRDGTNVEMTGGQNGEVRMQVGKYVCPVEYVNTFTPIEFEEIVHLFSKYDEDESGELDTNEMRRLLFESDMEYDEENAQALLEELDKDKSGLIDFDEFCTFIARIKAGDAKLRGFGALTETLNTTSVGVLEEQCDKRHLKTNVMYVLHAIWDTNIIIEMQPFAPMGPFATGINVKVSYMMIEERPATAISPYKHFVMEVRIEGEWIEPVAGGGMVRSQGMRRFQGIGKSTREGRMSAAEAALKRLRNLMPGLDVPAGVVPKEWERWLKDNARRGVELNLLLEQLRTKGFAPYANPEIMQWVLATGSLTRLIQANPAASATVDGGREVGPVWRGWIDHCLSIGLDGAVLVEVMQERGVSLSKMEGHIQRMRRGDGATGADPVYPKLLDFWQCCESGLLFEVELYLSAGQPPDGPALHVSRGAVSLPLALAAARGHCEVIDGLVSRRATVDATDLMGRTALHHAAKSGDVETCRRLLEYSAALNAKDTVGCTPLHMAARYNKADCCELLAFHGEETVRNVVSDRIPVADLPFTKIMEASFSHLIRDRLRSNETHRFRKEWIFDAVRWCRDQMHPSKTGLLQEASRELVDYVVRRFDPDPDAGFWQLNIGQPASFVPSVAEPWHLSETIRHILRLAVCASRDNKGWSALHQACVENRMSSHEETIRVLVHFHQLNLFQTDNNGKLAVELLFDFEGGRPNTPSGSKLREGLLMDQRKDFLDQVRIQQDVEDEEAKERGRVETLLNIRGKAVDMEPELWKITQEAGLHIRTLGGWMEYVDTETTNRFYYRNELVLRVSDETRETGKKTMGALVGFAPKGDSAASGSGSPITAASSSDTGAQPSARGAVEGERRPKSTGDGNQDGEIVEEESVDHFQWEKPEEFAREETVLLGWAAVINDSQYLRTHAGRYNSVLDKKTGVVFYVDTANENCLLTTPREATLAWAYEHSESTGRVLGQRREWEVRLDRDGNEFFCLEKMERVKKGRTTEEMATRDLRWERPVDAVPPVDLTAGDYALCTMDVAGYERADQPWYICQECDTEWKGDMEMFRVCVACARNCHKGRLGHRTRFCKLSNTRCMCCERGEGSCLYFSQKEQVVASSLEKRYTAADERASLDSAQGLATETPPILAYVPHEYPDGTPKDVRGWQICRRKRGVSTENGWTACHDPELPRRLPIGAKVRPRCTADARVVVSHTSGAEAVRRARDAMVTKGVFFWRSGRVVRVVSDDWYVVRITDRAAEEDWSSEDGLSRPETLEWEFQKERLCVNGAPLFYFHEERRECTWDLPRGVTFEDSPPPEGGVENGLNLAPKAIAEEDGETIVDTAHENILGGERARDMPRDSIVVATQDTGHEPDNQALFGEGDEDGVSPGVASSEEEEIFQTLNCGYPPLCLNEWEALRKAARVVCVRGRHTTYLDRETASLFFHDEVVAHRDKLILMVQRRWRNGRGDHKKRPRPITEAFSFTPPDDLNERMKLCTAWAYLRRGGLIVREVVDTDGDVWQELQDRTTGLHFFYCPELLKSRFHPPDLPPPSSDQSSHKTRLKEGDRVAFKFRGDTFPSTAEVVRLRETKDKTDAGDFVVSIHYDVTECETLTATGSHTGSTAAGSSVASGVSTAGALSMMGTVGAVGTEGGGTSSLRTERWLKRQHLTRAPKTAEEIDLDDKEAAWKLELSIAKVKRKKELARKAEEHFKAERLRKRGPSGVMIARRERGRTALQAADRNTKRANAEKALREEDARLALIEAQKLSQELQATKMRKARLKDTQERRKRKHRNQQAPKALLEEQQRPASDHNVDAADAGGGPNITPFSLKNAFDGGTVSTFGGGGDDDEEDPQLRVTEADRVEIRAGMLRETLRSREDAMTTSRTVNRRRVIRMVHMAMVQQADGFVSCEWGCRAWVRLGQEKFFHETEQCCKRILPCELGCGLRMREEEWLSPSLAVPSVPCQQRHEEAECPRRLVPCGQRCGEWLPFEDLMHHMKVSCVKRPFPPVKCRLGCGEEFHGGLHRMLQSEEERIDHEHELCQHRLLHCVWEGCEEMVMAKDRRKHREEHVVRTGVFLYTVPGKYSFKVPVGCRCLKVQAWGSGGGSGHFEGGQCGDGGGGAFVEALLYVTPEDELEITVGACGSAGELGSLLKVPGGVDASGKAVFDIVDQHGVADGGLPGGGAGHGGNPHWAAGGGGGYSMVAKKISSYGGGRTEPLVVAGAGGGGGSRAGVPGGGLDGEIPGTKVDMRNGRMGRSTQGGAAGDSGDINGCTFPPEHGQAWTGGNGGQYGGGGGSGWFGGGGGGTSPGIVGGGGGGSSFVNSALAMDQVVLQGIARLPGGTDRVPPRARGYSENDIMEGVCGEGGKSGPWERNPGNNGAVRIHKPGFFEKQLAHN